MAQISMFGKPPSGVTKVIDKTQGRWLQDAFDALDIKPADAARAIGVDDTGRIHQHLKNRSHLATPYLSALKAAYPQINMNYIIAGELPVLVGPPASADALRDALVMIRDSANKALGEK